MLKLLVAAGAAVFLMGASSVPTAIAAPSAAAPVTQSRANDCFDDCMVVCMRHSGADYTACQFECMMTTCLAEPPLQMTARQPATKE